MSNILQVTDPSTYIDNRNVHTGQEQQSALNSSQIQNPSDPSLKCYTNVVTVVANKI